MTAGGRATDLARRLADAVESSTAIAPLTEEVALSVEEAYAIQDLVLKHLAPEGDLRSFKLGLTSRAKQVQMKVNEPLYGVFTEHAELDLDEPLWVEGLIQPRVEPEIAFLLGRSLGGPDVTASRVLAATEAIFPALDVLDSRFSGYEFTLADVVADRASASRYVLGPPSSPSGDLGCVGVVFEKNGVLLDTAAGAAVLGHPAAAVAWLVRKLATRERDLPAGSVVMAGALTAAEPAATGDVFRVTADRLGVAEVRCE